jgi:acyl-CoA dehydrogenase
MSWDFSTEPDFQAQLDWIGDFVRTEIYPLEILDLDWPQLRRAVAPLQNEVKARRLWAAHLSPELGGQGYGQVKLGLIHELLGMSPYAPLVFGNQAPDSGNTEILAEVGTAEQKKRWLYPLLAGELTSAFALTERDNAGADPSNLASTAVRDGNSWILNGHKWFITNASIADFMIVVAVTDQDAERHRRTSQFIVPMATPGVRVVRDIATMESLQHRGPQPYPSHAQVTLEDVRVGDDALLGQPGDGFLIAQKRLGPDESITACVGLAKPTAPSTCSAKGPLTATPTAAYLVKSRRYATGLPIRLPKSRPLA